MSYFIALDEFVQFGDSSAIRADLRLNYYDLIAQPDWTKVAIRASIYEWWCLERNLPFDPETGVYLECPVWRTPESQNEPLPSTRR